MKSSNSVEIFLNICTTFRSKFFFSHQYLIDNKLLESSTEFDDFGKSSLKTKIYSFVDNIQHKVLLSKTIDTHNMMMQLSCSMEVDSISLTDLHDIIQQKINLIEVRDEAYPAPMHNVTSWLIDNGSTFSILRANHEINSGLVKLLTFTSSERYVIKSH